MSFLTDSLSNVRDSQVFNGSIVRARSGRGSPISTAMTRAIGHGSKVRPKRCDECHCTRAVLHIAVPMEPAKRREKKTNTDTHARTTARRRRETRLPANVKRTRLNPPRCVSLGVPCAVLRLTRGFILNTLSRGSSHLLARFVQLVSIERSSEERSRCLTVWLICEEGIENYQHSVEEHRIDHR